MNSRYPANRRLYLNPRGNPHGTQTSHTYSEDLDACFDNRGDDMVPLCSRQRRSISSAPLEYSRVFTSDETLKNSTLFPGLYMPLTKG